MINNNSKNKDCQNYFPVKIQLFNKFIFFIFLKEYNYQYLCYIFNKNL